MNINEQVRLKLTDEGLSAFKQHAEDYNYKMRTDLVDDDGFSTMPLWELMQVVGPQMRIAMVDQLIEGNEITPVSELGLDTGPRF